MDGEERARKMKFSVPAMHWVADDLHSQSTGIMWENVHTSRIRRVHHGRFMRGTCDTH